MAYKEQNIAEADFFDPDLTTICAPGIHFFLSLEAALCWNSHQRTNDYWDSNGALKFPIPPTVANIVFSIGLH